MYLQSLAQATPPHVFTQQAVWDRIREAPQVESLKDRSRTLLRKVLTGDSGIASRAFVLPDPLDLFSYGAQELKNHYEREAPRIAVQAVEKALAEAGVKASELDAVFVCSCTGYLCPGLSSYVAEGIQCRNDTFLQDVNGFGCGAAVPMIRAAQGFLSVHPEARVATVAVEACSLAFYLNDEPGVLISAALFGDAASAAIWGGESHRKEGQWMAEKFATRHFPEEREKIRFVNDNGFLKNQLHRSVPKHVGEAVSELWGGRSGEVDAVLSHSGGRDVVEIVEDAVGFDLPETRAVMSKYGNCSSPSVMMGLEERLRAAPDSDQRYWLTAFGAGFAAHSFELSRE